MEKDWIKELEIIQLKGLCNIKVPFEKNITAIMGVNGIGKSTILHALVSVYKTPGENGKNVLPLFFPRCPDNTWKGTEFIVHTNDGKDQTVQKRFHKDKRWLPQYKDRTVRASCYMGIDTCLPEIEKNKSVNVTYNTISKNDKISAKTMKIAAVVLNMDYTELTMHDCKNKTFRGVKRQCGINYTALHMGAGEQRVLKIIENVLNAEAYSIVLIDEIDLLLHVAALNKLIIELEKIAKCKKLQIVFTTHSLSVTKLKDEGLIDIIYLDNISGQIHVKSNITSSEIYKIDEISTRPIKIYVEDKLSERIVLQLAENLNIKKKIDVIKFGAAENSFGIAASMVIEGDYENKIIILDGDVYRERDAKVKMMKKYYSGSEMYADERRDKAVSLINQYDLPIDRSPEEFIVELLKSVNDGSEICNTANEINAVSDNHSWLNNIVQRCNDSEDVIVNEIINKIKNISEYEQYVAPIRNWMSSHSEV